MIFEFYLQHPLRTALLNFRKLSCRVCLGCGLALLFGCALTPPAPNVSGHVNQHTVTLTWTASTSTVSGYNVYRATVSGGPYTQINTALDAATDYVDNTVLSGQTYYYVTTAVSTTGIESAYSNQVAAIVPSS